MREPALAARVSDAARARGVLVWCSDDPARSDFAMPAIAALGPVRIAVSTAGGSPTLAGKLRAIFEKQLGERFADFVRALASGAPLHSIDERRAGLDGFELELTRALSRLVRLISAAASRSIRAASRRRRARVQPRQILLARDVDGAEAVQVRRRHLRVAQDEAAARAARSTRCITAAFDASVRRLNIDSPPKKPPSVTP